MPKEMWSKSSNFNYKFPKGDLLVYYMYNARGMGNLYFIFPFFGAVFFSSFSVRVPFLVIYLFLLKSSPEVS